MNRLPELLAAPDYKDDVKLAICPSEASSVSVSQYSTIALPSSFQLLLDSNTQSTSYSCPPTYGTSTEPSSPSQPMDQGSLCFLYPTASDSTISTNSDTLVSEARFDIILVSQVVSLKMALQLLQFPPLLSQRRISCSARLIILIIR